VNSATGGAPLGSSSGKSESEPEKAVGFNQNNKYKMEPEE
jgi:hypothetical protein